MILPALRSLSTPVHYKFSSSRAASKWTVFSYRRSAAVSLPLLLFSRFRFRFPSTSFFIFCTFRFPFNCSQWVYSLYFRSLSLIFLVIWLFFNNIWWSCLTHSSQNSARPHRNSSWSHTWYSDPWHFGVTESCCIHHTCKYFFTYLRSFCIFKVLNLVEMFS